MTRAPLEVIGDFARPPLSLVRYCDTRSHGALLDRRGGYAPARMSCHLFPHGGGVTGNGGVSSTP
jgi:hypothetical protein